MVVDPQPPAAAPDERPPRRAANGATPYRLPGPLSQRRELPVAPSAPRIPRALRAFNGMEAEETPLPEAPAPSASALTIRDLLEDPSSEPQGEEGRLAGLRTALRRLRRGRSVEGRNRGRSADVER